jgi:hypothetical protein
MKHIDASKGSQSWRKNDKQIEWLYVPYGSFLHRGIQIILDCLFSIGERERERKMVFLFEKPSICMFVRELVGGDKQ